MRQASVVLALDSIYTTAGMKLLITATLNGSIRVVNFETFTLDRFFDVVERCKVTTTTTSAFIVKQLLNHPRIETADLSSITNYFCAGTKVSIDVIQKMNKYLINGRLCNGYAMTEMAGFIAMNIDHQRNDCAGQLANGIVVKIVNDQGERLGVCEEGELCLKQSYPFFGYLADNKNAKDCFDSEGFLMTGDIGRFDVNGDLFIVDRKMEIFKSAGHSITPAELEELLDGIEGVKQSCVVPIPNLEHDFLPAAVIVKSDGSACTEQSIFDAVSSETI